MDAYTFFAKEVVGRDGFILSADTLNPAHLGPKIMPFAALDTKWFPEWQKEFEGHVWGEDYEADQEALSWMLNTLYGLTAWAHDTVPGMADENYLYEFGFSDYDGALLGWFRYPIEG